MAKVAIGFDKIRVHDGLLLGLPFREATGTVTRDVAKPHHGPVTLIGTPTWASLAANDLGILSFNGVTDYLECAAALTADLNFTSGDYSIVSWINWIDTGSSVMVMGRYGVDLDGWEVYFYAGAQDFLQLRHHHASFCPPDQVPCPPGFPRTGAYSGGWTPGSWYLMGITRSGAYPRMYRNAQALTVGYSTGGVYDPDTCNRDLVIGTRFTKDADWYSGLEWNPRIWNRELSSDEMSFIFERERAWFGL